MKVSELRKEAGLQKQADVAALHSMQPSRVIRPQRSEHDDGLCSRIE